MLKKHDKIYVIAIISVILQRFHHETMKTL